MYRYLICCCLALLLAPLGADEEQPYPVPSDDNPETDDSKPMLGVNMSPVPVPIQRKNDIAPDEGVYVRHVYDDTTATDIGIERGDVIIDINGNDIDSMSTVRDSIFSRKVGDDISVTVLRDGQQVELGGQLGGWPEHIPLNKINSAAEERYRQMQARRLARESQQLDKKLAKARQQQDGRTPNAFPKSSSRERSSNELDKLLATDFGGHIESSLPSIHLPALAALFDFRFGYNLHCDDPEIGATEAASEREVPTWTHLSDSEIATLAPDVDLSYAFCVSTESL